MFVDDVYLNEWHTFEGILLMRGCGIALLWMKWPYGVMDSESEGQGCLRAQIWMMDGLVPDGLEKRRGR